jgi:hypothetical protein
VFWFNNVHTCRQKLIDKIDNVILKFASNSKLTFYELVSAARIYDVYKVYKLQLASLMFDVYNNPHNFPYIQFVSNSVVHDHFTRGFNNVHIMPVSTVDCHNFIYNGILNWNSCPADIKMLPKCQFMSYYKQLLSGLLTILLKSIAITMEYFASKSIADTDSDTFYKKPFDTLPILIRYFLTILSNFRTV